MATTYCDYYGSVGATGYQSYHGCVTAPPIDPGDINNTCSIEPIALGEVARIDQGATWWCDYSWTFGGAAVDLTNYRVIASFYYPDGTLFTRIWEAAKLGSQFRLKLADETTDTLEFGGEDCITLTVDIDLKRIDSNDPITGYVVGDVVRISAGCVAAYRRGSKTASGTQGGVLPASDVRLGVDRGDGVLGTLRCYSVPDLSASVIELVHHDEYGGDQHPRLSWATRQDLTGKDITLLIFDEHDHSMVARFAGSIDSPTGVSVGLSAEFDFELDFCGCPPVAELRFALVADANGKQATIEEGRVFVHGRPAVAP